MQAIRSSFKTSVVMRAPQKASGMASSPLRSIHSSVARPVLVRAETEVDYSSKAQEYANKAITTVQTVWEETADAEKPAIIAILGGVVVAQVAIGATMSVIDKLPFFGDFFELVGLAVIATFTYRYVTDPSERTKTQDKIDSFLKSVTSEGTAEAPKASPSAAVAESVVEETASSTKAGDGTGSVFPELGS